MVIDPGKQQTPGRGTPFQITDFLSTARSARVLTLSVEVIPVNLQKISARLQPTFSHSSIPTPRNALFSRWLFLPRRPLSLTGLRILRSLSTWVCAHIGFSSKTRPTHTFYTPSNLSGATRNPLSIRSSDALGNSCPESGRRV